MQKVAEVAFEYGVRTPEVVAEDWAAARGVEESAQCVVADASRVPIARDWVDIPRRFEPHVRSRHDEGQEPVGSSFVVTFEPEERQVWSCGGDGEN